MKLSMLAAFFALFLIQAASPVGFAFAAAPAEVGAVIGQPAPEFTALDSNGATQKLSDYKGKVVVLEWTNNECPFVVKHYNSGNMQATQKKAVDAGVVWLSVISSAPEKQGHVDGAKANELTKSRNASPTAVLLDGTGEVGKLYGAKTTPHMFVIDKEGKLVYAGAIDSISSPRESDVKEATNYVTQALDEIAAGKPVSVSSTKSYGCGVKY
jgi:peroxiredoxin